MTKRETTILQAAEAMVRQGGYNSFSFRDIATEVGIKSASVHYHFPTKEDLGAAVAQYYTDKFIDALGDPNDIHSSGKNPIESYIAAFRAALIEDKGMCLCGVLGAEADALPESVIAATRMFFVRNIEWLERAYLCLGHTENSKAAAIQTVSLLEGAMITSGAMTDISYFDASIELLKLIDIRV